LKPENLIYATSDEDSPVKVIDFGLANYRRSFSFTMGTPCGTPGYVAPEVIKGQAYGPQVDLWSIGVILYVLLCGFPPFYSKNLKKMYKKIMSAEYDFPDPQWSGISQEAKDLISHLLTVDPTQRYTTKQVLAHPFIAGSAASQKPLQATSQRLRILVARKKLKRTVATVIAINKIKELILEDPTEILHSSSTSLDTTSSNDDDTHSRRQSQKHTQQRRNSGSLQQPPHLVTDNHEITPDDPPYLECKTSDSVGHDDFDHFNLRLVGGGGFEYGHRDSISSQDSTSTRSSWDKSSQNSPRSRNQSPALSPIPSPCPHTPVHHHPISTPLSTPHSTSTSTSRSPSSTPSQTSRSPFPSQPRYPRPPPGRARKMSLPFSSPESTPPSKINTSHPSMTPSPNRKLSLPAPPRSRPAPQHRRSIELVKGHELFVPNNDNKVQTLDNVGSLTLLT